MSKKQTMTVQNLPTMFRNEFEEIEISLPKTCQIDILSTKYAVQNDYVSACVEKSALQP